MAKLKFRSTPQMPGYGQKHPWRDGDSREVGEPEFSDLLRDYPDNFECVVEKAKLPPPPPPERKAVVPPSKDKSQKPPDKDK